MINVSFFLFVLQIRTSKCYFSMFASCFTSVCTNTNRDGLVIDMFSLALYYIHLFLWCDDCSIIDSSLSNSIKDFKRGAMKNTSFAP